MEEIIIRSATLEDLPVLLEFEQGIIKAERPFDKTLADDPISYYDLGQLVKSEKAKVVIAEIDNRPIGSGFVRIDKAKPYLDHDLYGYLGFMFVREEFRGRGVNKRIIQSLLDWCGNMGIDEVRLEVYSDNQSAVHAYEKAGFSKNLVEMRLNLKN